MINIQLFHDTLPEADKFQSALMQMVHAKSLPTMNYSARGNVGSSFYYTEMKTLFPPNGITNYPAIRITAENGRVTTAEGVTLMTALDAIEKGISGVPTTTDHNDRYASPGTSAVSVGSKVMSIFKKAKWVMFGIAAIAVCGIIYLIYKH